MVAVVLIAALTAAGPSTTDRPTHTRPRSDIAQTVVDDAVRASPTIQAMIAAIEHTDVFVYVDARFSSRSWRGSTRLVGAGVTSRFVEVTINLSLARDQRAEVLGHELQHVLEIARATDVRDLAGMKQLFDRIGWRLGEDYETAAAVDVERAIHEELWSLRSRPHAGTTPTRRLSGSGRFSALEASASFEVERVTTVAVHVQLISANKP